MESTTNAAYQSSSKKLIYANKCNKTILFSCVMNEYNDHL